MNNDVQNNNSENSSEVNPNENNQNELNQNNNYNPNQQSIQQQNQQPNFPPQGTKEYDDMMRAYYGQNYDLGLRVSFMKRVGSYIVDALFIGMISLFIYYYIGDYELFMNEYSSVINSGDLNEIITFWKNLYNESYGISLFYTTVSTTMILIIIEVLLAASPGKLLLSIKIANLDRTNSNKSKLIQRAMLKYSNTFLKLLGFISALSILNTLASIAFLLVIISYFFALGEKRQTLYDMICGTTVYHVDDIQVTNNNQQ